MFIIISGPSGAGKTPLLYDAVKRYSNIEKVQSYTTRPRRQNEIDGTYIYLTHEEFEQKIKEGFFFEYNKVHKYQEYYGTSLTSLNKVFENNKVAIKDIDVDGYKSIKEKYNDLDIVGIYVTVKNRNLLFDRLRNRGENEETIKMRLYDRADYEDSQQAHYDYVIYADSMPEAIKEFDKIIEVEFNKRNIKFKRKKIPQYKTFVF